MQMLTKEAGRAVLTVVGPVDYTHEGRQVWRWQVAERYEAHRDAVVLANGDDLHTGVGHTATPREMMASLCNFLTAAAESADYAMRHGIPLAETDNGDLFPHAVLMLASQESDEIGMLAVEMEEENDG